MPASIHRDQSDAWISDRAEPDPDPAPFTTIGWRLLHIADCKVLYHEWAFGPRELSFPDLLPPTTAEGALARLEEGHRLLRGELEGFADRALDEPRLTSWSELWPALRIFWTMIDHDAHHGAEIGCLRDVYRVTDGARLSRGHRVGRDLGPVGAAKPELPTGCSVRDRRAGRRRAHRW